MKLESIAFLFIRLTKGMVLKAAFLSNVQYRIQHVQLSDDLGRAWMLKNSDISDRYYYVEPFPGLKLTLRDGNPTPHGSFH